VCDWSEIGDREILELSVKESLEFSDDRSVMYIAQDVDIDVHPAEFEIFQRMGLI
jgi:hypothetical protein